MERGQAKLSLNSSRGVEKVIAVIRTGDVFAEAVTFFENKCYPADCTALQDSVVLGIDMHQFAKFLHNSNELCMALLRDLSGRLHRKINEIRALALENATIRTLGYLYSLIPAHSDGQIAVRLDTPKQTIASILSITPETFSRVLNQLSQEGLVVLHERDILINDISALKERLFFQ
jgi:CRP-like cAMP-binding protein